MDEPLGDLRDLPQLVEIGGEQLQDLFTRLQYGMPLTPEQTTWVCFVIHCYPVLMHNLNTLGAWFLKLTGNAEEQTRLSDDEIRRLSDLIGDIGGNDGL